MIKLYSSHCPKCSVIEKKLEAKNLKYELIDNDDEVMKAGDLYGMHSLPILVVDDKAMDFIEANRWVTGVEV